MEELQTGALDQAAFQRVWQRVMPEPRPDCPFTVDTVSLSAPPPVPVPVPAVQSPQPPRQASPEPPICLGETSSKELPTLERLLDETEEGVQTYQALARRWRREPLLPTLAREKRRQAKRLSAARFLIAGEQYASPAAPRLSNESLSLRLRGRFQAEQRLALEFFSAANAADDPCLIELYRDMGRDCQDCAKALRTWLETR